MAYGLEQFVADCRTALKRDAGPAGREVIRQKLERLLRDKDFLARYCADTTPAGSDAWLPAVIALVMVGFGTLGTWEILHQLEQFRFELAAVATAVALLHALAAVAAYVTRTARIPGEAR